MLTYRLGKLFIFKFLYLLKEGFHWLANLK